MDNPTKTIRVLIFHPGMAPIELTIVNTRASMEAVVGGPVEFCKAGFGTVAGIHQEGKDRGLAWNRYIPASKILVAGTFFCAADWAGDGSELRSLLDDSIAELSESLLPYPFQPNEEAEGDEAEEGKCVRLSF